MLTLLQTETGALPVLGSPAGQAALPHGWLQDTVLGIYSFYLYFHYRRTWAVQHLCKGSLILIAEGLRRLSVHPHLSWIRLSLQYYVTIPSISPQDLVCHQYLSLEGCEAPASSLLDSLTLPHLSMQSHKSLLLLLHFAKLPLCRQETPWSSPVTKE